VPTFAPRSGNARRDAVNSAARQKAAAHGREGTGNTLQPRVPRRWRADTRADTRASE